MVSQIPEQGLKRKEPQMNADVNPLLREAYRADMLARYREHSRHFEAIAARREPSPEREPAAPAWATHPLTSRELDVVRLIAAGQTDHEIAQALFVAESTVKSHVKRLLVKLGARNRAHVVAIALRTQGLGLA